MGLGGRRPQARLGSRYSLRIQPVSSRNARYLTLLLPRPADSPPPYCARLLRKQWEKMPWRWVGLRKQPHTLYCPRSGGGVTRVSHGAREAAARRSAQGHGGRSLPHHSPNLHSPPSSGWPFYQNTLSSFSARSGSGCSGSRPERRYEHCVAPGQVGGVKEAADAGRA
jgi:hypothetical protein